jgi:uncharacterized protein YegP (UPF0339 family)
MAAKFEIRKSKNEKQFLFNLKAANGQVVLSSELYDAKKGAEKGIASVKKNAANDKRFERKTAKNGELYFVLKAMNGEIIGTSERYNAAKSVEKGIASVKKNAPDARVDDLTA